MGCGMSLLLLEPISKNRPDIDKALSIVVCGGQGDDGGYVFIEGGEGRGRRHVAY